MRTSVLSRAGQLTMAAVLLFCLEIIPLISGLNAARAATTVSINTAQQLQAVNGLGVNANSHNWNDTDVNEFKQAMDDTADLGNITWRVITDKTDWETTNDNADPFVYNWAYYNSIYSQGEMTALWNTIEYLEQNHPNQQITINFMGDGPDWMGPNGGKSLATNQEDEWAEMVSSLVYYGRVTRGLHFKFVSPTNEEEFTGGVEGIHIPADQYVRIMHKLSDRLDSLGLNDVRFIGPDNATTLHDYYNAMRTDSVVMNRTDHIAMHAYTASLNGIPDLLKNDTTYPGKDMWVTEFSAPCPGCDDGAPNPNNWTQATGSVSQLFADLDQGAAGAQIYDAWDGYYRHHASMGYWGLIAYSGTPTTPGDYSKRKSYYAMRQIMKYIPRTARMVSTSQGSVSLHAFTDTASGRLTLVGYNSGAAQTVSGSINASAGFAGRSLDYTRTNASVNMGDETLAPVTIATNNTFSFDVPANTVFTLTGTTTPDTTPPPSAVNPTATVQSATRVNVAWQSGGGDTASYTINRSDLSTPLVANLAATSYSDTTVQPNTTYQYSIIAKDGSGNASPPVTTASVTTPLASPIAVNAQAVTKQASTAASISATISTTLPNTLLTAFITSDGPTAAQSFSSVTTNGLTWTLRQRANTQTGTAEIWTAPAQNTLTNAVVTANRARTSYRGAMMVTAFSGADTTVIGTSASANASTGASSVSLTPTQANSVIWGVGYSKATATTRTVGSDQTMIDQYLGGSTGTSWFQRRTDPTLTPGTTVTLNNPSPTNQKWNMVAIEILPVVTDATPPTVSLTAPLDSSTVSGPVTVTANASDNVAVTKVEFYLDGVLAATDTSSPHSFAWNTLTATNGLHTLSAKAYDAANNSTSTQNIQVTVFNDTEAPSAPTLSAILVGQNQADLNWTAATDNVAVVGYDVYRGATKIASLDAATLTYSDSNLPIGTHQYKVVALDAANNATDSNTQQIVVPDTEAPTTPTNLAATNVTSSSITLGWTAATDNVAVTGYQILRDDGTGTFTQIATTNSLAYTDSGRSPSTTYSYKLSAYDAAGNHSAQTAQLDVTTTTPDTTPPSTPTNLAVSQTGQNQVDLTWTASTDDTAATSYEVVRNGSPIGTSATTSFSDTSVIVGTGYTYQVTARDAAGNVSSVSDASAITIADTTKPTVSLTAPANGAVVNGTVALAATAADNVGVVGVQFKVGSTDIGTEDTTNPYQANWNSASVADGSYALTAIARDAAGNTEQSTITVTVQNTVSSGLIAAYNFNAGSGSTLADITGKGHAGTITGATWTASGKNGGALTFNGTSNWVTVADTNDLDFTTGFTIEAWVKPSSTTGWRTIAMKEAAGSMPYGLYATDDTGRPPAIYGRVGAPGTEVRATGGSVLPTTSWSHVTGTYNGSILRLYVNGVQVGTANLSGNLATSTGVLRIGGNGMWGEYFGGQMDDLRIYNRALTSTEIVQDMNTAL